MGSAFFRATSPDPESGFADSILRPPPQQGHAVRIKDVIGFDTKSKNEKRNGKVVKGHRITDRYEHFNPDQVLKHWTEHPEVLMDLDQVDAEIPLGSGISVIEERNG